MRLGLPALVGDLGASGLSDAMSWSRFLLVVGFVVRPCVAYCELFSENLDVEVNGESEGEEGATDVLDRLTL